MGNYQERRDQTIANWYQEYEKDPSRPSLKGARVAFRMRPDGLTIREIRIKLATEKDAGGAKSLVAPPQS